MIFSATPSTAQYAGLRPAAPISAAERQKGAEANPGLVTEYGGAYSGPQAAYALRVGRRVAVQTGLGADPSMYTVTLLNSPVNNAFAIPGGYVYVTRELMALMNDEAELAGVLGHEIGHVAARHSARREKVAKRNAIAGLLGQVLVGAVAGSGGVGQLLSQGIGTGTQLATLKFSRAQETEADDLAVQYLTRAGYDPSALSRVLASLAAQERFEQGSSGDARSLPAWASTHPDPQARVQRAAAQAAATRVTSGLRNRDAVLSALDGMLYGDDPRQGVIEGSTFLHPVLRIAFTIPQGFTMENGATAVSITGPNAKAQFSMAGYAGNLRDYVGSVLASLAGDGGGSPQAAVQETTINGIPAAYTQVRASSGSTPVDVTVFAYAPSRTQAYHFVALSPAGQGLGAMSTMVQSFRTITSAQAAAIKPRFVRIVTAKAGETSTSMSQRMAYDDRKLERFLILNGLTQSSPLTPGQKVKIITR
ncbi:MAG: M48 family metalloprotease [Acidobacteria bacterium]|nr:M48 family metalloprotease [Acidobacteriota bacterium]